MPGRAAAPCVSFTPRYFGFESLRFFAEPPALVDAIVVCGCARDYSRSLGEMQNRKERSKRTKRTQKSVDASVCNWRPLGGRVLSNALVVHL